jgi:starch synthase
MENQRICYTIHNFKHQGICSNEVLNATGLNRSEYYLGQKILSEHDSSSTVNFMKGGITYSNFVNTVSPHHAWESRFTDQGHGLGHTLHANQIKYGGILNGIDYSIWNPEIDSYIPAHYSVNSIHDKYKNKRALRDHFWLYHDSKPIIAFIGRLDGQKGLDLIHHTANYALHKGAQFVLLGVGSNNEIHDRFNNLKNQYNDNPHCHIELSFSEQLSHLIYAGADMIIVPSVFEPCGLTQLIALKYGTIPIARSVGGIVNTVFDRDHSDRPWWQRNGYTFNDLNFSGIESAINRAIGLYYDYPNDFRELMSSGMRQDYSWNLPGSNYVNIFDYIRHK